MITDLVRDLKSGAISKDELFSRMSSGSSHHSTAPAIATAHAWGGGDNDDVYEEDSDEANARDSFDDLDDDMKPVTTEEEAATNAASALLRNASQGDTSETSFNASQRQPQTEQRYWRCAPPNRHVSAKQVASAKVLAARASEIDMQDYIDIFLRLKRLNSRSSQA